jgi:nitrate reductase NapAB chaperone NapD
MSVLGVVARSHPKDLSVVLPRLQQVAGVDIVASPGDGRVVLVIEDVAGRSAAACLGELSGWPEWLATSLVYEYSGEDSPAPHPEALDWRTRLEALDAPSSTRP